MQTLDFKVKTSAPVPFCHLRIKNWEESTRRMQLQVIAAMGFVDIHIYIYIFGRKTD